MPLANALLSREQLGVPAPSYPLDLVFCQTCALVQITETVPPEELFSEYLYFSSFSETMLSHARDLVERIVRERSLGPSDKVIEIASNDGYLLQYYKERGIGVLGIEPAANVAEAAYRERGVPTLCAFFDEALARKLREDGQPADVVHAHNVLAHVADLGGFVDGLRLLLRKDGLAVIEVPYVRDLVERCEFDTIYHEHLCYFSVTALDRLFRRHALLLRHVERVPIHGGSLRVFAGPEGAATASAEANALLAEESACGLDRLSFYRRFSERVEVLRASLRSLLARLKSEGKRIAAYGAAAKGTVMLNALDLPPGTIDFVVDRSTYKQGRYVPGVRLLVLPAEKLLEAQPDYVLLLAWNLAGEVLEQQGEYRRRGGRFIIPVPDVAIV